MSPGAGSELAWLSVLNVALGIATAGTLLAVLGAVAYDLLRRGHNH
jgi:hypothetical protein